MIGGVRIGIGEYANAFSERLPFADGLVETKLRSQLRGEIEMRLDGAFREQDTRSWLPDCGRIVLHVEEREFCGQVCGTKNFVREFMLLRAAAGSAHQRRVARTDHQTASFQEEMLTRFFFQIDPELIRTLDEGDIERVFEIRFANDSR